MKEALALLFPAAGLPVLAGSSPHWPLWLALYLTLPVGLWALGRALRQRGLEGRFAQASPIAALTLPYLAYFPLAGVLGWSFRQAYWDFFRGPGIAVTLASLAAAVWGTHWPVWALAIGGFALTEAVRRVFGGLRPRQNRSTLSR